MSTHQHSWQEALQVFCVKSNFFAMQRLFPRAQIDAFLPPEPLVDPANLPYAKQLDIGYLDGQRMRPLNGPLVQYLTPYRHSRWVGFWLNRTANELQGRSLWIDFLCGSRHLQFPELAARDVTNVDMAKKRLEIFLYGRGDIKGIIDLSKSRKTLPRGKNLHFCLFACYANNVSFRNLVGGSIARMRRRGIFDGRFVDDVLRHFEARSFNADRMVNGLVSLDLMAEAGLFD